MSGLSTLNAALDRTQEVAGSSPASSIWEIDLRRRQGRSEALPFARSGSQAVAHPAPVLDAPWPLPLTSFAPNCVQPAAGNWSDRSPDPELTVRADRH
jgi:hypothetical protein